ncbi:MAG TPA: hypothetical protein VJT73_16565 [Polyangiaceae bacterium]|nr:hypothetical protein [Polyangiaceae bacterium]
MNERARRPNWKEWPHLLPRVFVAALVLTTFVAYAASLPGPFLNWDDHWLVEENPFLARPLGEALAHMFFDLSRETRLQFGAEYLPVRDLAMWIDVHLWGAQPLALRITSLATYLAAVVMLRALLVRLFGATWFCEVTALVFAIHPVHVESVAWIAGRKDVLALFFVCAALAVHAGSSARRAWLVPVLVALAVFSKSMSVAVLPLLVAQDYFQRKRPRWTTYGAVVGVCAVALALHGYVGGVVGIYAGTLGGSRYRAFVTMGPVWLRYLGLSVMVGDLSLVEEVPVRASWDLLAVLGYGTLALGLALAVLRARRGERHWLLFWIWFVAPLLPVSQVFVPLQNRMADRYLCFAVLGPVALGAWWATLALPRGGEHRFPWVARLAAVALAAASLGFLAATFSRALLFTDSVLVFSEATRRTQTATMAPYQLGKALEASGQDALARIAFAEVLRRSPTGDDEAARRATNNLAKLLARAGLHADAEVVLVKGLSRWPGDAKIAGNLAKLREMPSP